MSTNITEFKLRNIEEFDADFVQSIRIPKKPSVKPADKTVPSLIPELDKNAFSDKSTSQTTSDITDTKDNLSNTENISDTTQSGKPAPRPLVPIGSGQTAIPPEQEKIGGYTQNTAGTVNLEDLRFEDETEEEELTDKKKRSGKGALALKIISIVFLSVTIISFLLGCLVSVFLNNNGIQLADYCFNSQVRDVTFETDAGKTTVNEGALIISKPLKANEYETNMIVSVLASDESGNEKCEIFSIGTIIQINNDVVEFELIAPDSGAIIGHTTSADCYGLVEYYIPVIGGIISFSISSAVNAVLVCALFILIAAFWFLLLVLSEKKLKASKDNR